MADIVDALTRDLRSALRRILRARRPSVVVVFSLALGIGASTAIFSVARSVLFTSEPYRDLERVVLVELYLREARTLLAESQAAAIQRLARSFERVEASSFERLNWRRGDSTVRLMARVVTPDLPSLMGIDPFLGRGLAAADADPGAEPVALISEGLWRRELAAAGDVLGTTIVLGDTRRTIVGVARAPLSERNVDAWLPRRLDPAGKGYPTVIAWLRPGVSPEQAASELQTFSEALAGDRSGLLEARLFRPGERARQSSVARTMYVFWAASAFLLAIVCANVASLLLARNLAGQREIAIRAALGATSAGIVRLLLVESVLLGIAGGVGGVFVGTWGTAALLALRPLSLSFVYPNAVPVDAAVIGYSLGLSIVVGLLVGAAPALGAVRADLLRGAGRDDPHLRASSSGRWMFGAAVALQAALAVVLLAGALLMVNSYLRLQGVGPGFDPDNVVEMAIQLDPSQYAEPAGRRQLFAQVAERIGALGGVSDAALATDAPPHGAVMTAAIELAGRPSGAPPIIEASWVHVSSNYFRVLRIPQVEGRTLADADATQGNVIVSQSFARRLWPGESAVGRQFRLRREAGWGPWMQVVGIVGDVTGRGLRDELDEIYLPFAAGRAERSTILARVEGDPSRSFQAMEQQLWTIDPDVPVAGIVTVRERLARSIDEQPFYAMLLGVFACIALALAAVGVFGVASYAASQRMREIGIRLAIGAQPADVERLIALQGLVPSLIGIVAGLAGAFALARTLQSMTRLVYGVSVTDSTTYVSTALTLAVVSAIATWLPARRASRVDPMIVLRSE